MIGVVVHAYVGGYGDYVQLAGIYDSLEKAKQVEKEIREYYTSQIEVNEYRETFNKYFCIDLFPIDLNRTYSIDVKDEMEDIKNPLFDTDLPVLQLGSYAEG